MLEKNISLFYGGKKNQKLVIYCFLRNISENKDLEDILALGKQAFENNSGGAVLGMVILHL